MKFKTKTTKTNVHKGTVICVTWCNNDEVYSISDDHQLYKWTVKSIEQIPVAKLPEDFYPTDLHWLTISRYHQTNPSGINQSTGNSSKLITSGGGGGGGGSGGGGSSGGVGTGGNESLLISSNDGRFIILNKSARVERNIAAHAASISSGRWSPDGAGLLTAAEDGVIKVWSRSGMLRSTVVQNEAPIRYACWSPTSQSIAYCQSGFIAIKSLAANSKLTKWRAHDGLCLCLNWSNDTLYLVSGGEDCRYKIWDFLGALLYSSFMEDYAITSVSFSPNGELLAIGGFNSLRLCNYTGWSYGNTRFEESTIENQPIKLGSLFSLSWSQDGTQVVAGTASGHLTFGYVIEQESISKNLKAKTVGRKTMQLQDISTKTIDLLDFPDRIIQWKLGYDHLIVATTHQVHIYNQKYINTPLAMIDGRHDVRVIILAKKHFLVVDSSAIWIYTYAGRLHLNPKYPGMQSQLFQLNSKTISLGLHYLAIRDSADRCLIRIFDLIPGATRQTEPVQIHSKINVTKIDVSRAGNQDDQYMVFIDENRDLFCTTTITESNIEILKIGTQVISCMWGSESNILVGLHDSCYSIWYCPGEASADPTIIALTTLTFDTAEFGKNVWLENFEGPNITFKCSGILYTIQVNVYCEVMHRLLANDQWTQALKICRRCQNLTLWATLGAIASKRNQLEICEEAYAAALQIDKVDYLQYLKNLPNSSPIQLAEHSLMLGRTTEAETILLHNKNIVEAIMMYIRIHQWEKGLAIAKESGDSNNIDLICEERKKYLKALGKDEYSKQFLDHHNNK